MTIFNILYKLVEIKRIDYVNYKFCKSDKGYTFLRGKNVKNDSWFCHNKKLHLQKAHD
jgi:hypothetical protein